MVTGSGKFFRNVIIKPADIAITILENELYKEGAKYAVVNYGAGYSSDIYKEKGDTATAVQFFRRVCDKYPDYALAFEELGVLYASRGENMALEYLNTALQLDPSNTNTLYALAMFYQGREDFDKAESLYHQMLDINEHSADVWHNLGWIELTHYHDYERAIEYFDKALAINPQMENALVNRELALKNKK